MRLKTLSTGTNRISAYSNTTILLIILLNFAKANSQLISTLDNSHDNSPECDCYVTSGLTPGYFPYHRFYDFRSIPPTSDNDYTVAPPLITLSEDNGTEPFTSAYLKTTPFSENWFIQSWTFPTTPISPLKRVNSASNIYVARNTTTGSNNSAYLTLRTHRPSPSFVSIAELESQQRNLLHSSIRASLRVVPSAGTPSSYQDVSGANATHPVDPGAVVGLFTYSNDANESDIEILTRDPITRIRYTNQPSDDDEDSTDAALPDSTIWTEWLDHRIDWFSDVSRWYVDDFSYTSVK